MEFMLEDKIPELSLEQKIGQLLVVGFHGQDPQQPQVVKMQEFAAAGFISGLGIYRYNIASKAQLKFLLAEFRESAEGIPVFISLDQEGGKVQRLNSANGFADTLSAKKVAETMSSAAAFSYYEKLGGMLKEAGFNFNCAPCVDLDGVPGCGVIGGIERSYSDNVATVVEYAGAMIAGLKSAGVLSCLKHYPGHGRAGDDSHAGLVDITGTWTEEELRPYQMLIDRGQAPAVMSAHLINSRIDPDHPATLSKTWLSRLRKDLGFQGLIVSDCLHMGAIIKTYSLEQVVALGLNAGIDLFYFSNNPLASRAAGIRYSSDDDGDYVSVKDWRVPDADLPLKFRAAVMQSLSTGVVTLELIEQACRRVLRAKESVAYPA